MNWMSVLKLIIIIVGILALYGIAVSGTAGKILTGFIVILLLWYYTKKDSAGKVINPVTQHYANLMQLCHLNRNPTLRFLVLGGDLKNPGIIKGKITGGAVPRKGAKYLIEKKAEQMLDVEGKPIFNKDGTPVLREVMQQRLIEKPMTDDKGEPVYDANGNPVLVKVTDERADGYVVSYTPQFGLFYDLPVIGTLMSMMFRKEYLFFAFKHQLESQQFIGDLVIKAASARFVGLMEYPNDWITEAAVDTEMALLNEEVERLTLVDNLSMLPTRIRNAIDASSTHGKMLDLRDELMGMTK